MAHLQIDWDEIDKNKFPDTLKRYRLYRGYTKAKLAEKIGVKNTTISNYEKGVSLPDLETLLKIARVLKVDPGEFYVDWRFSKFSSTDNFEDVVPTTVQVEKDFVTGELTGSFVSLPAIRNFYGCRAVMVPRDYIREDDNTQRFVVTMPVDEYVEGDVVVAVVDRNETFIGVYGHTKSGDEILKPFRKWNPERTVGILVNRCVSFEMIGKVICYDSQEIVI